jgi:hypothetical protein
LAWRGASRARVGFLAKREGDASEQMSSFERIGDLSFDGGAVSYAVLCGRIEVRNRGGFWERACFEASEPSASIRALLVAAPRGGVRGQRPLGGRGERSVRASYAGARATDRAHLVGGDHDAILG